MALGRLLTRSTQYTVSDTVTGLSATYFVQDNLGPSWVTSDPYRGGMSIPGAWRASTLLSDLLGSVPWNAYRTLPGRDEELLTPRPPLLEQPNPPDPRMSTFSSWGLDLIWHGNAIGVIAARDRQSYPTAVVPIPAQQVGVRRITEYMDTPLPVGALEYSIGALRFGSRDLIHIKGPCPPGATRGMGVLEAHMATLTLAADQNKQARSISNHGVPTGVIETELNPDDPGADARAADLKAAWLASQSTRSVAVLGLGTKFTPLSWNPEELELVEARKFTLTELELIFGLPVGWLGGQTSSRTYANIEQDAVNLIKFTLSGHLGRFEGTLSLAFPRYTEVRANLDSVLRADTLTRYQAHQIGIEAGFLLPDEARELEHRPPLPEKPPVADEFTPGPTDAPGQAAA